jgi:hypothetical protein
MVGCMLSVAYALLYANEGRRSLFLENRCVSAEKADALYNKADALYNKVESTDSHLELRRITEPSIIEPSNGGVYE